MSNEERAHKFRFYWFLNIVNLRLDPVQNPAQQPDGDGAPNYEGSATEPQYDMGWNNKKSISKVLFFLLFNLQQANFCRVWGAIWDKWRSSARRKGYRRQ